MTLTIEIIEIVIVVAAALVGAVVSIVFVNAANQDYTDSRTQSPWAKIGVITFNVLIMGLLAFLLVWAIPDAVYNIR